MSFWYPPKIDKRSAQGFDFEFETPQQCLRDYFEKEAVGSRQYLQILFQVRDSIFLNRFIILTSQKFTILGRKIS